MYVEHEMYSKRRDVSKTILMQKTRKKDETMWIMGPSSFRVTKIFEFQMLSLSFSQNESGASTIQLPTFPTAKLEPIENDVLVLFDF